MKKFCILCNILFIIYICSESFTLYSLKKKFLHTYSDSFYKNPAHFPDSLSIKLPILPLAGNIFSFLNMQKDCYFSVIYTSYLPLQCFPDTKIAVFPPGSQDEKNRVKKYHHILKQVPHGSLHLFFTIPENFSTLFSTRFFAISLYDPDSEIDKIYDKNIPYLESQENPQTRFSLYKSSLAVPGGTFRKECSVTFNGPDHASEWYTPKIFILPAEQGNYCICASLNSCSTVNGFSIRVAPCFTDGTFISDESVPLFSYTGIFYLLDSEKNNIIRLSYNKNKRYLCSIPSLIGNSSILLRDQVPCSFTKINYPSYDIFEFIPHDTVYFQYQGTNSSVFLCETTQTNATNSFTTISFNKN